MTIVLGELIKEARENKEITRAELAEIAGVSEETLTEIEDGEIMPDFDTALLLVSFLGLKVDIGWLLLIADIETSGQ